MVIVSGFAILLLAALTFAQGTPAYTVITVEKMHCNGCAQRIAKKLYEVPGVEKIQVDVQKKLFWVHPQTGKQPSPKLLWEAVEKGDDKATKLQGPSRTFTKKPQS
ncbi:MAG: heavy-metal-associated domain-containing protein [Gemmataceae bacterium]|nr:heavy-metal-associated domain-containing protein [Gemmataceae bacterium]MCI0740092.1 heavy-metal-associated domain-containing protein [Gemmataceae bacterium]